MSSIANSIGEPKITNALTAYTLIINKMKVSKAVQKYIVGLRTDFIMLLAYQNGLIIITLAYKLSTRTVIKRTVLIPKNWDLYMTIKEPYTKLTSLN